MSPATREHAQFHDSMSARHSLPLTGSLPPSVTATRLPVAAGIPAPGIMPLGNWEQRPRSGLNEPGCNQAQPSFGTSDLRGRSTHEESSASL